MSTDGSGGKRNFLSQHQIIEVTVGDEIRRVRAMSKWSGGNRHVESLVKGDGINVALVMLKQGVRLDEHSNKAPFSVQVSRAVSRSSRAASDACSHREEFSPRAANCRTQSKRSKTAPLS